MQKNQTPINLYQGRSEQDQGRLLNLPYEVLLKILKELDLPALIALRRSAKMAYEACSQPELLRKLYAIEASSLKRANQHNFKATAFEDFRNLYLSLGDNLSDKTIRLLYHIVHNQIDQIPKLMRKIKNPIEFLANQIVNCKILLHFIALDLKRPDITIQLMRYIPNYDYREDTLKLLLVYVASGATKDVKSMVKKRRFISPEEQQTLITAAVESPDINMLTFLEQQFDTVLNLQPETQPSPFNIAISVGNLAMVKYLVEHRNANVNEQANEHSEFPIYQALIMNRLEIAEYLHQHGADINKIKQVNAGLLGFNAMANIQINPLMILLGQACLNTNVTGNNNFLTALMPQFGQELTPAICWLINKGAVLASPQRDTESPILTAFTGQLDHCLALLIKKRAAINLASYQSIQQQAIARLEVIEAKRNHYAHLKLALTKLRQNNIDIDTIKNPLKQKLKIVRNELKDLTFKYKAANKKVSALSVYPVEMIRYRISKINKSGVTCSQNEKTLLSTLMSTNNCNNALQLIVKLLDYSSEFSMALHRDLQRYCGIEFESNTQIKREFENLARQAKVICKDIKAQTKARLANDPIPKYQPTESILQLFQDQRVNVCTMPSEEALLGYQDFAPMFTAIMNGSDQAYQELLEIQRKLPESQIQLRFMYHILLADNLKNAEPNALFQTVLSFTTSEIIFRQQDKDNLINKLKSAAKQNIGALVALLSLDNYKCIVLTEEERTLYEKHLKQSKNKHKRLHQVFSAICNLELDVDLAKQQFKAAADQGCRWSQLSYATALTKSILSESDLNLAHEYLQRAAHDGEPKAQFLVSIDYIQGSGCNKDVEQAFFYLKRSARQNYTNAHVELGQLYEHGVLVSENKNTAFLFYQYAAEIGCLINGISHYADALYLGIGTEIEYAKARENYEILKKHNRPHALFRLGNMYDLGQGGPVDKSAAFECYKLAADLGHITAQHNVGVYYLNGYGIESNLVESIRYYIMAAKQGDIDAQKKCDSAFGEKPTDQKIAKYLFEYYYGLADRWDISAMKKVAVCYFFGRGTEKNYGLAFKYYQLVANKKDAWGQYEVAICYRNGEGVEQDLVKSIQYYILAAKQGHKSAQKRCDEVFEEKSTHPKIARCIFNYYKELADQGDIDAQFKIAICYYRGFGVEKNSEIEFSYYKLAADKGHSLAQFNAGICYRNGDGVQKDLVKSIQYYIMAAKQGHLIAIENCQSIFNEKPADPRIAKYLFDHYKALADQNDVDAQFYTGTCYDLGYGVEKNNELEFHYYKLAADNGSSTAQYNVGVCYRNGEGVERDLVKGIQYYIMAAKQGYPKAINRCDAVFEENSSNKEIAQCLFHYYKELANQGHVNAQLKTGICYFFGRGVEKNNVFAFNHFKSAADNGQYLAQYNTGVMLIDSLGINRDENLAIKYLQAAEKNGYTPAADKLRQIRRSQQATLFNAPAQEKNDQAGEREPSPDIDSQLEKSDTEKDTQNVI